jgi:hypothetical protein
MPKKNLPIKKTRPFKAMIINPITPGVKYLFFNGTGFSDS